jgi:hypothetical protein
MGRGINLLTKVQMPNMASLYGAMLAGVNVVLTAEGKLVYRCPAEPVDAYVAKGGTAADAVGRRCLCNGLVASVGLAQARAAGEEQPLITSGDDLLRIPQFHSSSVTVARIPRATSSNTSCRDRVRFQPPRARRTAAATTSTPNRALIRARSAARRRS